MSLPNGFFARLKGLLDVIEDLNFSTKLPEPETIQTAGDDLMDLTSRMFTTMDLTKEDWKTIYQVCDTLGYSSITARVYLSTLKDVSQFFCTR